MSSGSFSDMAAALGRKARSTRALRFTFPSPTKIGVPNGRNRLIMRSPLRILHLEDDPNDASLVESVLESEGIACATTCVKCRDDFVAALKRGGIDLILSDFSLPALDGFSAIATVRAGWPDLPVILVSGSLGEQRAIDSLKSGATD